MTLSLSLWGSLALGSLSLWVRSGFSFWSALVAACIRALLSQLSVNRESLLRGIFLSAF